MKKNNIIILTLFVFHALFVCSQSIIEVNTICDNEVSTYWDAPSNNNLPLFDDDDDPSTPPVPMTQDDRYLNRLDWVNGNTGGNGYTTENMFFTQNDPYGDMTNVKPLTQTSPWYHYLYYGEELTPDNGWEMLLHNLGYFPNAMDIHSYEENKFTPYIVLYNRYTGVIRVFVTYGKNPIPLTAIKGIKVDLSFATNSSNPSDPLNIYSGILRHGVSKDQALDQVTEVTHMSAVGQSPVLEHKWYSVDFQVAYDPCTCIYPSRLSLSFNWFSELEFGLNGRQLTLNEDLSDSFAQELIEQDFLGSFEFIGDDAQNGFIIYASLEKAVDDYIKQMEEYQTQLNGVNQYNARIKRNSAIMKAFKAIVLGGFNPVSSVVTGVSITAALSGGAAWATDISTNAADLISADTLKFYTLTDEAKKLLGSQFDFFSNKNFKEKPKPTKPSQPIVAYSEMAFKGKITSELDIPGPDFMAPGTFNSNSQSNTVNDPLVYKYPIYNDVLGTFALLETPKFIISRDVQDEFVKPVQYKHSPSQVSPTDAIYQSWTNNFQIKMASDLKFALNSVLDIKSYNIELAIEIKDLIVEPKVNSGAASNYWYADGLQQCYTDPDYTTNLTSMNSEVDQMENIHNYYPFTNGSEFDTPPGYDVYKPWVTNPPTFKKGQVRTFQSDFVPLDAFFQMVHEFGIKNDFLTPVGLPAEEIIPENYGFKNELEIELKVKVDIEFHTLNQYGENNSISETYTYKIPESNFMPSVNNVFTPQETDIVSNLSSTNNNLDFPKNLNFDNVSFDGTVIDGCEKVGNTYTCKALENIALSGVITTSNGYFVDMIAGKEIVEYPGSIITGEVIRQINQFYDYSHPMPQITEGEVISFCGTINEPSIYRANFGKAINDSTNVPTIDLDKITETLNIRLYPNPAQNIAKIELSREASNVNVQVYDISGRRVDCDMSSSGLVYIMDVSKLTTGLYLVKVSTVEGTIIKNLIVK